VREKVNTSGRQRRVEGILISGDRVIIVDDLVATGRSIQRAAAAIRSEGGVVTEALVLLDREEGAREKLLKQNITLHSIVKIGEVAKTL
jgi:orotate phosphoribosyltransferase